MRRSALAPPLLLAAVVPLLMGAACGSPAASHAAPHAASHAASPRATTSNGPFTVAVIDTDTQGRVFTDPNFLVLYEDANDSPATGSFDCAGPCLKLYHPLLTQPGAALTMPPGVVGKLSSVVRPDGVGDQVTVNGFPVYTFSGDQPGETGGLMGVWRTVPAPVQLVAAN